MRICQVLFFLLLVWQPVGHAEEPVTPTAAHIAVERGIGWLLKHQAEAGFFNERVGAPLPKGLGANDIPSFAGAITALAVMALHESGHRVNDRTPEGRAMLKAVTFVCREMPSQRAGKVGYLGQNDRSRMYGHGIMTWMLATVAGDLPDQTLRLEALEIVRRAVALSVSSQKVIKSDLNAGGWRYEPEAPDSDLSITVWQLMAIRAATLAGIEVPERTVKAAAEFVKRCGRTASPSMEAEGVGMFSYESYGGRKNPSTTGAGVMAMQCCGLPDAIETKGGLGYIEHHEFTKAEPWLYYGLCHCSHAMAGAGADASGAFAAKVRTLLVPLQSVEGAWLPFAGNEKSTGPVFSTALAVMALAPWSAKQ